MHDVPTAVVAGSLNHVVLGGETTGTHPSRQRQRQQWLALSSRIWLPVVVLCELKQATAVQQLFTPPHVMCSLDLVLLGATKAPTVALQ